MPTPFISDESAEMIFNLEAEIARARETWKERKGLAKDAKFDYDDARSRLEDYVKGLREQYPLFDRDEPSVPFSKTGDA